MQDRMLEKITSLFEYRKIPFMIDQSNIIDKEIFYQRLITLQYEIYRLDHHLETIWEIDVEDLSPYWEKIYSALSFFVEPDGVDTLIKEIEIYQSRELDLRKGVSPLVHDIENLYYHKSCDVRLLRNLIYLGDKNLQDSLDKRSWYAFDLITEVNDDIEDLYEDLKIYNANRFLFAMYEMNRADVKLLFRDFLNKVYNEGLAAATDHGFHKNDLEKVYRETLTLLSQRLDEFDAMEFIESKMIKKYTIIQSTRM